MLSKSCTKCLKIKESNHFYSRRDRNSALSSWCKDCTKDYSRQNPRQVDPANRKIIHKRYYDKHPEARVQHVITNRQRLATKRQCGYCLTCSSNHLPHSQYCLLCLCQLLVNTSCQRAKIRLTLTQRKSLALLLSTTVPLYCPYTQEPIVPGKNLHLDHKIPISIRPDLAADISNLQWVSKAYNYCKWDMTDAEFASKYTLMYIGD